VTAFRYVSTRRSPRRTTLLSAPAFRETANYRRACLDIKTRVSRITVYSLFLSERGNSHASISGLTTRRARRPGLLFILQITNPRLCGVLPVYERSAARNPSNVK